MLEHHISSFLREVNGLRGRLLCSAPLAVEHVHVRSQPPATSHAGLVVRCLEDRHQAIGGRDGRCVVHAVTREVPKRCSGERGCGGRRIVFCRVCHALCIAVALGRLRERAGFQPRISGLNEEPGGACPTSVEASGGPLQQVCRCRHVATCESTFTRCTEVL